MEPLERDRLEYELTVRQEPKQARMCGVGGKADRRPIDPPPIVQLRVIDPVGRRRTSEGNGRDSMTPTPGQRSESPSSSATVTPTHTGGPDLDNPENDMATYSESYLQNPYYFMFASLAKPDDDAELHWLRDGRTRCTTGSVVSSLYHLKDPQNQNEDAGFFVFPDLSVRTEGSYRLKLSLFEVVHNSVRHCKSIYSAPFYVYTAKKFPGMEESTPLSCSLADQGIKIRIRKDIRVRKRPNQNSDHGAVTGPPSFASGGPLTPLGPVTSAPGPMTPLGPVPGTGPLQPLGPVPGTSNMYPAPNLPGMNISPAPNGMILPPHGATTAVAYPPMSIPAPNAQGRLNLPSVDTRNLPAPTATGVGKGMEIDENELRIDTESIEKRDDAADDDDDDDDDYEDQPPDDDDDDEYQEDHRQRQRRGSTRRRTTTPKRRDPGSRNVRGRVDDDRMLVDGESKRRGTGSTSSTSSKKTSKDKKAREVKRQKRGSEVDTDTPDTPSSASGTHGDMPAMQPPPPMHQGQSGQYPAGYHGQAPQQWGHPPPPPNSEPSSAPDASSSTGAGPAIYPDNRYQQYYDQTQQQQQQQQQQPQFRAEGAPHHLQQGHPPPPSAGQYLSPGYGPPPHPQFTYSLPIPPPGQYGHQQYYGHQPWGPPPHQPMTYPQQVPSYGPPSGSDPYVNYQQAQYPPRYDYPPPPPHPSMYAPAPVQHYSYYEQGPHIPPQASSQPPVAPQFNTSSSTAAPTSVSSNAPSADFSATSASNSSSTTAPSVPQSQRPQSPATRYPIPPPPSHILPPQHPYYTTMPPPQQPYSYGVYGAIYPQSTSSLAPSANMEPWGTPPAGGWGANNGNSEGYVSHHGQQQPGNDRIQLAPLRVGSSPTSNSPSSISPVSSTSAQRGHNSNFPVVQLRGNREHEDRERARKDRDGGKRNPLSIGSIISDETS